MYSVKEFDRGIIDNKKPAIKLALIYKLISLYILLYSQQKVMSITQQQIIAA